MLLLDRRGFVVAAAGALSAAAGAAWWARVPAAAAGAPALSARRAATFRALARSLGDAPDGRFAAVDPGSAAARLGRWYAAQDAASRGRVDTVLDAVADGGRVPAYGRLARGASACRGAPASRRSAAVAAAVDLVALVSEPAPAEDERPAAPALELPA